MKQRCGCDGARPSHCGDKNVFVAEHCFGGVPHAIGGGRFMVELQEPSDLMVVAERLTPSDRASRSVCKSHRGRRRMR